MHGRSSRASSHGLKRLDLNFGRSLSSSPLRQADTMPFSVAPTQAKMKNLSRRLALTGNLTRSSRQELRPVSASALHRKAMCLFRMNWV